MRFATTLAKLQRIMVRQDPLPAMTWHSLDVLTEDSITLSVLRALLSSQVRECCGLNGPERRLPCLMSSMLLARVVLLRCD